MTEKDKMKLMAEICKSANIQQLNFGDGYQQININPSIHSNSSHKTYCTYIVSNPQRPKEDIEADLIRTSQQPASVFASCLKRLEEQGCLDFGKDSVKTIFNYLKNRYNISYDYANFSAVFSNKKNKFD